MRSWARACSGAATPEIAARSSPVIFAPRYSASSRAVRFMAASFDAGSTRSSSRRLLRIDRLLARGPRLPALVNPQPLVGIAPHVIFNHPRESRRVFAHVGLFLAGAHEFHGRLETQAVFPALFVPGKKPGNYGSLRAQGDASQAGSGASRNAEKIYEHSFFRRSVVIGEDAHRSAIAQDFQ